MNFKTYMQGWSTIRIVRLILGVLIVIQGIITEDFVFGILGSAFSLMPMFNMGGSVYGACKTPIRKKDSSAGQKSLEFEK